MRRTARPRARPDGLHAGLITGVESAYDQLAVPEYRSWGDRGSMVRWLSAPGKLLRACAPAQPLQRPPVPGSHAVGVAS